VWMGARRGVAWSSMHGAMPMHGMAWPASDTARKELARGVCARSTGRWTSSCEVGDLVDRRGADTVHVLLPGADQ
jgi:hypothetical protein